MDKKVVTRFFKYVNKTPYCWEWTGYRWGNGRPAFSIGQRRDGSHRISWEIHKGPIPCGMSVLHKCDNPLCVNPDHLFIGTQKDNVRDMINKGRHNFHLSKVDHRGDKNWVATTTSTVISKALKMVGSGIKIQKVADLLGLKYGVVYNAHKGYSWNYIES